MQDWPIEVFIPADIENYLDHYEKLTDDDKKFVLMEGILDATEHQPTNELFIKYWSKVKQLLENDFNVHEYTVHYYACFEIQTIEDYWKMTPLMRQIWADKTTTH
jgi:hypothetical protein